MMTPAITIHNNGIRYHVLTDKKVKQVHTHHSKKKKDQIQQYSNLRPFDLNVSGFRARFLEVPTCQALTRTNTFLATTLSA